MAILHVKLNGPRTRINIPSTLRGARFKLKAYRILFNREDHGYYQASLNCTLFNSGNVMNFVKKDDPNYFAYDIPLFIHPEKKLTYRENVDWDLGDVQNVSSTIEFNVQMFNCIERKRFDMAVFDSTDATIQGLYNKAQFWDTPTSAWYDAQTYFGMKIPMYISTYSQQTSTSNPSTYTDFGDTTKYKEDGSADTTYPVGGTYPSAKTWVHTGVHIGTIDPQPGNKDYDTRPIDETERKMVMNGGKAIVGGADNLTGSGYRKGALIYAYAVDLVFEITT